MVIARAGSGTELPFSGVNHAHLPHLDKVVHGDCTCSYEILGIKNLKDRLGKFWHMASQGKTIGNGGAIIAELGSTSATHGAYDHNAALAGLIREGLITPPLDTISLRPHSDGTQTLDEILDELDNDRSERCQ